MCILVSVLILLSPISVCASDQADPIEPVLTFQGYEILGYDLEGNAILSNDDYEEYLNSCLAERVRMSDSGMELPAIDEPASIVGYAVQPYDIFDALDETKFMQNTRFIGLPLWAEIAWEFAKYMLNNPTMSAGEQVVFDSRISSVAKRRIYYSSAQLYELITINLSATPAVKESTIQVIRSGLGATSTFMLYSTSNAGMSVTWTASGYQFRCTSNSSTASDAVGLTPQFNAVIQSYAVNSLPTSTTTRTTLVPSTNELICGTNSSPAYYAENTFATNSPEYQSSHTLAVNNARVWQPCSIYNIFPIKSGDVINQNNVNLYADLGYSWNPDLGSIELNPDVLAAYIDNTLMPQLELLYKNAYQKFPDVDANINDTDISYENPFEDDENPSDTLPPATLPPGGGGGGMTPEELDGVLNQETFYIMDMETALPAMTIDTLPEVNLPAELSSGAVGLSNFVIDLFDSLGILPIFVSLSVLAFVVFTLKGG